MTKNDGLRGLDEVQAYEVRPRTLGQIPANGRGRLPIKTDTGVVREHVQPVTAEEPSSDAAEDSMSDEERTPHVEAPAAQDDAKPEMSLLEAKEYLAKLGQDIVADPEEKLSNLSRIRELEASSHSSVAQLALLTQVAVFQDILPGYSIRPLTDLERKQRVTKDVKRLREFEESLVSRYHAYVTRLQEVVDSTRGSDEKSSEGRMHAAAVRCACRLLIHANHFNHRDLVIRIVVRRAAYAPGTRPQVECIDAITHVFINDLYGRASIEITRSLIRTAKQRHFRVAESLVGTLLDLGLLNSLTVTPTTVDGGAKKRKRDRVHMTKKARKTHAEMKKIEKEMQEAEAVVNEEERERLQNEALRAVFVFYLEIMREEKCRLVSAALKGIAKFSHLINLDLFGDVLEALRYSLANTETADVQHKTLCINTAYELLRAQQNTGTRATQVDLDLSAFQQALYAVLMDVLLLNEESMALPEIQMMINSATHAFFHTRNPSPIQLSAFFKRMYIISLQLSERPCMAVLAMLSRLRERFSETLMPMYGTNDRLGDGEYNALANDPMQSNARTATIYETALLRHHYSPRIRTAAAAPK